MPFYLFYPRRADGVSFCLDAKQLDNDEDAAQHARRLARDHLSSSQIEVWEGERLVYCFERPGREASARDCNSN